MDRRETCTELTGPEMCPAAMGGLCCRLPSPPAHARIPASHGSSLQWWILVPVRRLRPASVPTEPLEWPQRPLDSRTGTELFRLVARGHTVFTRAQQSREEGRVPGRRPPLDPLLFFRSTGSGGTAHGNQSWSPAHLQHFQAFCSLPWDPPSYIWKRGLTRVNQELQELGTRRHIIIIISVHVRRNLRDIWRHITQATIQPSPMSFKGISK